MFKKIKSRQDIAGVVAGDGSVPQGLFILSLIMKILVRNTRTGEHSLISGALNSLNNI